MIVQKLDDFAVLKIKGVDYRLYLVGRNKEDEVNLLNKSAVDNKLVL